MALVNKLFESIELNLEDCKNVLRKAVEILTAKTAAINSSQEVSPYALVQEENFHWILNFATSLMANQLNSNSVYYNSFQESLNDSIYN